MTFSRIAIVVFVIAANVIFSATAEEAAHGEVSACAARGLAKGARCRYTEEVLSRQRMRGVMLGNNLSDADYADLAAMGATLVRFQIHGTDEERKKGLCRKWSLKEEAFADHYAVIDSRLDYFEKVLVPAARRHGFKVVVDHHGSVGGRLPGGELRMVHDRDFADAFVEAWDRIARRCAPYADVLYGYDLHNEPLQEKEPLDGCDYWTCQLRAAVAVRRHDSSTPVIFSVNGWDSPEFFKGLQPVDMDNAIYQVHFYSPGEFTHQGIHTDQGIVADNAQKFGKVWPRPAVDGRPIWDFSFVKAAAQPVRDFELLYGAKIFVGEFSAPAYAKGAEHFIGDVIAVCEEFGWDWTYHAFREAPVWSVEYEPEPSWTSASGERPKLIPCADSARKRVLLDGFNGIVHRSTAPIEVK